MDRRDEALARLRDVMNEPIDSGIDALEVVAQVELILDMLDHPEAY